MKFTKQFLSPFVKLMAIVLICAVLGAFLLWGVYHIPSDYMYTQMLSSSASIGNEGEFPEFFQWCTSRLDNFTDSLMLLIAGFRSSQGSIVQAMSIPVPAIDGENSPLSTMTAYYIQGETYTSRSEYNRYWHGYLVLLKPLLTLTDYTGIRFLNSTMQSIALCLLCCLMTKRGLRKYIPAFLLSYAFLCPPAIMSSLQYSSCFYVMLLSSIGLLLLKDKDLISHAPYIFLFAGIGIAYFDLLTYPVVSLGVPAVLYCCRRNRLSVREAMIEGANVCFFWAFGYGGMWISKWVLGSLILRRDILRAAAAQVAFRTAINGSQSFSFTDGIVNALRSNIQAFFYTPAAVIFGIFLVVLMIGLYRNRKKAAPLSSMACDCFPFVILALIPLVWFVFASNHSAIHYAFTNKSLMVSVFAVLCAVVRIHPAAEDI